MKLPFWATFLAEAKQPYTLLRHLLLMGPKPQPPAPILDEILDNTLETPVLWAVLGTSPFQCSPSILVALISGEERGTFEVSTPNSRFFEAHERGMGDVRQTGEIATGIYEN